MKPIKVLMFATATFALVSGPALAAGQAGTAQDQRRTGQQQDVTGAAVGQDQAEMQARADKISSSKVKFQEGSAALTEEHRNKLREMVKEARGRGEIEDVSIAAWSDKPLPAEGESLTEADRNLAEQRYEAVANFLRDELEIESVTTYNMAESANWLARTFNTDEAELKALFGREGEDAPRVKEPEFHVIRQHGGPSMAVVVIEQDHDN
jgi:outer membrane protein OmpA-like peptidoglycan-associated protein